MPRVVDRIINTSVRQEGDGLPVRRGLPIADLVHANPFLLVEEVGPVDLTAAGAVRTAPPRPARGYEELTWMLEGTAMHRRASGATAVAAAQASWVTVGSGDLLREEFLAANTRGIRVWIALPRSERRVEPRILTVGATTDSLRTVSAGGVRGKVEVQLIAGSLLSARAPVQPQTRATVARVTMPADTTLIVAVDSIEPGPEAPTVLLYGLDGHARVGHLARAAVGIHPARALDEQRVDAHDLAVLRNP
ncbi:MAG: pirin family protein, partial [Gemmatimonadota bacterium]|nr:pirin family protein [Gemmatimonadota bacterium]